MNREREQDSKKQNSAAIFSVHGGYERTYWIDGKFREKQAPLMQYHGKIGSLKVFFYVPRRIIWIRENSEKKTKRILRNLFSKGSAASAKLRSACPEERFWEETIE